MSLAEAILSIQSEVLLVHKDGKNPHHNSNYPTLESVLSVLSEPLRKNKVVVNQETCFTDHGWVLVTVVSCGNDSDQFETPLLGIEGAKNQMQALGSAITYARRYALMSYFSLAPTDDDGEAAASDMEFLNEKPQPKNFAPSTDYKVKDGFYKGRDLSSIPSQQLSDYIKKISNALEQQGQQAPDWFLELCERAGKK